MTFKMKAEHIKHIADCIAKWDDDANRAFYASAGLSDERYRWDVFHLAGLTPWSCKTLYTYLNDDHIDSVLRSIVKPLNRTEEKT